MIDIILENNNEENKRIISCDGDNYINNPADYRFLLSNVDKNNNPNQFDKNKDLKLHLNVLPHPYFGNIETPTILFLAKNPSYADYYEDEVDTYIYLKRHKDDLFNYLGDLKKVNFFKEFKDDNVSFYSSWKWWNKKIIRNVELINKDNLDKIGFINLCGYQSKSFDDKHFENFRSISKNDLSAAVEKAEIVIVVWGKMTKIKEIQDLMENYSVNSNKVQKWIVLNDGATGTNVNSLESILNAKKYYEKKFETSEEEKIKFEKLTKIYGKQFKLINSFFKLKESKNS